MKKAVDFDKKEQTKTDENLGLGCWDSMFHRLCEVNYGCCCCASLRRGALIFAWLFAVWFYLQVVGGVLLASVYNEWIKIEFLIAENDNITLFHKVDPFLYVVFGCLQFSLSVVLIIGIFNEANMRFGFIRVFLQSFFIILVLQFMYEASKFVIWVGLEEKNGYRIYASMFGFFCLQGIYAWGAIVVKCYYVEIGGC